MSALCQQATSTPTRDGGIELTCEPGLHWECHLWGRFRETSPPQSLAFGTLATALPASSRVALALDYPTRQVHWIVCFAPGGANDSVARVVGNFLSERFGQQFVIENRVGAGGNVGMEAALSAAPDGYTIVFVGPNNAISASLYKNLPFNFLRDSVPIAGTMQLTNVMVVNLAIPANTLPSSSPMRKPIPARSTSRRGASARHRVCRASCSSL
jgi:tripartite-type tricarboxylate transporter receptor subunit TctC